MLSLLRQRRFGIAALALCTLLGGLLPLAQRVCAMEMPAMEMMEMMEDCCCDEAAPLAEAPLPAPAVHVHAETAPCATGHCFDALAADLTRVPQATVERAAPGPHLAPHGVFALPGIPPPHLLAAPISTGAPPLLSVSRSLLFSTMLC